MDCGFLGRNEVEGNGEPCCDCLLLGGFVLPKILEDTGSLNIISLSGKYLC